MRVKGFTFPRRSHYYRKYQVISISATTPTDAHEIAILSGGGSYEAYILVRFVRDWEVLEGKGLG